MEDLSLPSVSPTNTDKETGYDTEILKESEAFEFRKKSQKLWNFNGNEDDLEINIFEEIQHTIFRRRSKGDTIWMKYWCR
jgi:hypothetical protein